MRAMKDSGIEWIGEIPEGWEVCRIKNILKEGKDGIRIGPFGSSLKLESIKEDGEYKVYGQEHLINRDFQIGRKFIDLNKYNELKNCEVKVGDILISMMGTIGKCCVVPQNAEKGIMDSHLIRLKINKMRMDNHYFEIVFSESKYIKEQLDLFCKGTIMSGLNSSIIKETYILEPPLVTQKAIADYLDRKCSLIDSTIEKQKVVIEKLKLYKQSVITEAVTKGLDPNVKMKPSGIEWIGEIPEGWEVRKFKNTCSLIKDGTHNPPQRVDEGLPLLSVRNIIDNKLRTLTDDSLISPNDFSELSKSLAVEENDILLAIVGATLGKVAIVYEMPPFAIQRSLAVLRVIRNLCHHNYLYLFIQSHAFQSYLWTKVGFSAQPGVYLSTLRDSHIPLPSLTQQEEICEYLNDKCSQIDSIITSKQKLIDKLTQYKKSLIYECVTGKREVV